VLCFAPAGGGASFFGEWRTSSSEYTLVPVELPGKEKRFVEEPHRRVSSLLTQLLPEIRATVGAAERVGLFGHSFGAVLAYEVAAALAAAPGREVSLFVSGSPSPASKRGTRITGLDDDAFLAGVREFAGYWHPALEDPELRELLLPSLRSDVEMHETYKPGDHVALDVPIVALRGRDDALVPAAAADEWRTVSKGPFRLEQLPGGHMYLVDAWPSVVDIIESAMSQRLSS
jgi:surfactin synthase thioesterase subunit